MVRRVIILSLAAVFVGAVFLWPRSYFRSDAFRCWREMGSGSADYRYCVIYSGGGGIMLGYQRMWLAARPPSGVLYSVEEDPEAASSPDPKRVEWIHVAGFGFQRIQFLPGKRWGAGSVSGMAITIPYWFLFGATGVPVGMAVRRWWVRSGRREGSACRSCGYDLRATPGRCPECGAGVGV